MTSTPAQPSRDRALGRGVATLIPQSAAASPTDRAAAALAAIHTVPVHVGVLQAAIVLLEEMGRNSDDEPTRHTVDTTVALLRAAANQRPDPSG
ncbi:hypothetical protein [Streptomyces sp. NPDC014894]|uniref:hypothetical protein n=1 Tax=unclassified Streptomyces TaxID=2593676 RepID=UPI0036F8D754